MAKTLSAWHYARLALLAGAALIPASTAHGDVHVLSSDVPGITTLDVLNDDTVLDIPDKGTVKVLLVPGNVMKVIVGPYKGTALDYAASPLPSLGAKPESTFEAGTTLMAPEGGGTKPAVDPSTIQKPQPD